MIVEIINPSDKAYMQHDEPKILAIAAMESRSLIRAGDLQASQEPPRPIR